MREHNLQPPAVSEPLDPRAARRLRVALAAGLALTALVGCSNSILRNTAEAGYETLTDAPAPTPTLAR